MVVLGITGSFDRVDEHRYPKSSGIHNASATLVRDGRIIAAVEEERFNRFKHSGKLPVSAIGYCLDEAGVRLTDLDRLVFNVLESHVTESIERAYRLNIIGGHRSAGPFIQRILARELGCEVDPRRFAFIDHHHAHAASAFYPSGFEKGLVVTLDGVGAGVSGSVWLGAGNELTHLRNYDGSSNPVTQSIGHFYIAITSYLGFRNFDEYKVMGLAPYGDAGAYRSIFSDFISLRDQGQYDIHLSKLERLTQICPPRARYAPIERVHMDIAATAQECVERIIFHILEHYRAETKESKLCIAGGVAQNCAANGKLLRRKLFKELFIQPASHDGGLSLGSAMYGYYAGNATVKPAQRKMRHAYLGPQYGGSASIEQELRRWEACIEFEKSSHIAEQGAQILADGKVIAWMQGRSEFGPRALGNRSILADPRPAANRELINSMVKKRESFRPFAPSVLEEHASEYFELPQKQTRLPFMTCVTRTREKYQKLLGAVTHVDGTARIQTVSRRYNRPYWELIAAFGRLTGLPVLLNTSFNNNAEPIVNTPSDAVVCYLTTNLDVLIVGDFVVRKRAVKPEVYDDFKLSLPDYTRLQQRRLRPVSLAPAATEGVPLYRQLFDRLYEFEDCEDWYLDNTHDNRRTPISETMARLLSAADGFKSLRELTNEFDEPRRARMRTDLLELWSQRLVKFMPASR